MLKSKSGHCLLPGYFTLIKEDKDDKVREPEYDS